jgi:hypothetical protein
MIEINGRKYDVLTGKPLDGKPTGFKKGGNKVIIDIADKRPAKPTKGRIHHASPTLKRKPEKSRTLMRPAVKKPKHKVEHKHDEQSMQPIVLPHDKDRLGRAKAVKKSPRITKFNLMAKAKPSPIPVKAQKLEVKPHPEMKTAKPHSAVENDWPVIDRFERAMQEASSHLETFAGDTKKHSKKRKKLVRATAGLVALLVIGFGAYSVIPTAKVKLAGNKAGFSPSVPSYSPAGYGLVDPVETDYGKVALSYKSRTDDKGFKLTQEPSKWNSESLANNFLNVSDREYRTINGAGRTIYTYDGSAATWVDGGIWFKLEGNANLTEEQLVNIARGL